MNKSYFGVREHWEPFQILELEDLSNPDPQWRFTRDTFDVDLFRAGGYESSLKKAYKKQSLRFYPGYEQDGGEKFTHFMATARVAKLFLSSDPSVLCVLKIFDTAQCRGALSRCRFFSHRESEKHYYEIVEKYRDHPTTRQ